MLPFRKKFYKIMAETASILLEWEKYKLREAEAEILALKAEIENLKKWEADTRAELKRVIYPNGPLVDKPLKLLIEEGL